MNTIDIDNHSKTIIHIDVDYFYAQVEINKNPALQNVPMGVFQKSFIVTSNYIARNCGIKKCMKIDEGKKLCPSLILVNGEDLHDYRQISYKITALVQRYSNTVECLGLDENFIDVTNEVYERLKNPNLVLEPVGNIFGDISERCLCGCTENLIVGSMIAQEIRDLIKKEMNLTTCAGVAHNKLLAKLVGKQHKPDQQTIIFPNSALELMLHLKEVTKIPGIGRATADLLSTAGITTVADLQNSDIKQLEQIIGDKAQQIYDLSYGIDKNLVKATGRPQSIGIEDSYCAKSISVQDEVQEKLRQLLDRLLILVREDGRIPKTLKLTVRKQDKESKISHRESRQCNINPSLFKTNQNNNVSKETRIMSTIMHLFNRIVDCKKPYHITLLGLSFTKFQDPPDSKSSIAQFLRNNIEVQSLTSIENKNIIEMKSPTPSTSSFSSDFDLSPTPSPKKFKLTNLTKRINLNDYDESASPSKLRVADLCLGSTDIPEISCPPTADKNVFKELPKEIQKELWEDYKRERGSERNLCNNNVKKSKPNTLLNYFIRN